MVDGATVGVAAAQSHVFGRELVGKHDDDDGGRGARKRTENEEDIIGRRRRNVYMCCGGLREECHIFVGRVKEDLTSKQEVRGDLPRIDRPFGASKGHLPHENKTLLTKIPSQNCMLHTFSLYFFTPKYLVSLFLLLNFIKI